MRRGPKPAKSREAKPPVARKSPKDDGARVRDLEKRLAEALQRETEGLKREAEALQHEAVAQEQQAATAEILRVISSSPTDLQPVFDTIVKSATRLCESADAHIFRRDGERLVLAAHCGQIPARPIGVFSMPLDRGSTAGRSVLDGRIVHIADLQGEAEEFPEGSKHAQDLGHRTILQVPLMREGVAIGTIGLRRTEVRPFTERQTELLQTFADQAIIAIENVRLFKELQASNGELTTALDKQTATSEILRVISRSPTNLEPVFDAIVRSAVRLCGANHSVAARFDGELLHPLAFHGFSPKALDLMKQSFPMRPTPGLALGRPALSRAVVNIPDALADPEYARDFAVAGG